MPILLNMIYRDGIFSSVGTMIVAMITVNRTFLPEKRYLEKAYAAMDAMVMLHTAYRLETNTEFRKALKNSASA